MGWYGADVTPWIFYENFIGVMVNIDGNDGCAAIPLVTVMVQSSEGQRRALGGLLH
jgi:hypothetical protein